ncbi:MAG: hypothetical protein RI907_740 [Pseudomonadota bacterium]|jgi:hypothetical protein
MIHHLARAFHVRERAAMLAAAHADTLIQNAEAAGGRVAPTRPAPVRPRPITPWTAPRPPAAADQSVEANAAPRAVRIASDPADARRTVIAGRFAEVCAALDRLVREQEAMA